MNYVLSTFAVVISSFLFSNGQECNVDHCPKGDYELVCGFEIEDSTYRMFPNKCAMRAFSKCSESLFIQTPVEFCIKYHNKKLLTRRSDDDESCPLFCAKYWRPVCGARELRAYSYRSFLNSCYLDMINCRGNDDYDSFHEVPLEFCQRHAMKNFYAEKTISSGLKNTRYYE